VWKTYREEDDGGWAQAGCVLAAPGILVAVAATIVSMRSRQWPVDLTQFDVFGFLAALTLAGFVVYATAGITAAILLGLAERLHPLSRVLWLGSYVAWVVVGLVAGILWAGFILAVGSARS
jgi:ABC-type multidrug transport system permease subunit